MKTVSYLLETLGNHLQSMIQKSKEIELLNQHIQPILPAEIQGQCAIANYEVAKLKLLVKNAGIATLVRFLIPKILDRVHEKPEWRFIQQIVIVIPRNPFQPTPDESTIIEKNKAAKQVPAHAASGFEWLAAQESDPKLKAALLRLIKNN